MAKTPDASPASSTAKPPRSRSAGPPPPKPDSGGGIDPKIIGYGTWDGVALVDRESGGTVVRYLFQTHVDIPVPTSQPDLLNIVAKLAYGFATADFRSLVNTVESAWNLGGKTPADLDKLLKEIREYNSFGPWTIALKAAHLDMDGNLWKPPMVPYALPTAGESWPPVPSKPPIPVQGDRFRKLLIELRASMNLADVAAVSGGAYADAPTLLTALVSGVTGAKSAVRTYLLTNPKYDGGLNTDFPGATYAAPA